MKPTFAITLREGTEAAKCISCSESTHPTATITDYLFPILSSIFFIIAIMVAASFVKSVGKNIDHKENFNGTVWGIINGIFGGIIFSIAGIFAIYSKINKIKDKKYKKYAKEEMKNFIYTYFICLIFLILIIIAIKIN